MCVCVFNSPLKFVRSTYCATTLLGFWLINILIETWITIVIHISFSAPESTFSLASNRRLISFFSFVCFYIVKFNSCPFYYQLFEIVLTIKLCMIFILNVTVWFFDQVFNDFILLHIIYIEPFN